MYVAGGYKNSSVSLMRCSLRALDRISIYGSRLGDCKFPVRFHLAHTITQATSWWIVTAETLVQSCTNLSVIVVAKLAL
jgi:hypothetical protein